MVKKRNQTHPSAHAITFAAYASPAQCSPHAGAARTRSRAGPDRDRQGFGPHAGAAHTRSRALSDRDKPGWFFGGVCWRSVAPNSAQPGARIATSCRARGRRLHHPSAPANTRIRRGQHFAGSTIILVMSLKFPIFNTTLPEEPHNTSRETAHHLRRDRAAEDLGRHCARPRGASSDL